MAASHKRYDKRYFDKWYRDVRHRVVTPASTRRKAALALAMAEYYLERPVVSVLDVGCGEGHWQPVLKRMRPKLRYTGVDASAYAVKTYGKRRNIVQGDFAGLGELPLAESYDLVVCSDVLYYIPDHELYMGMAALAPKIGGIAFLEAYANDEFLEGDTKTMDKRGVGFYERLFRHYGLRACGSHCYAGEALAHCITKMERGGI